MNDFSENDETRTYNCYGVPVDLTVPEGRHIMNNHIWWPFDIAKIGDMIVPMNHGGAH